MTVSHIIISHRNLTQCTSRAPELHLRSPRPRQCHWHERRHGREKAEVKREVGKLFQSHWPCHPFAGSLPGPWSDLCQVVVSKWVSVMVKLASDDGRLWLIFKTVKHNRMTWGHICWDQGVGWRRGQPVDRVSRVRDLAGQAKEIGCEPEAQRWPLMSTRPSKFKPISCIVTLTSLDTVYLGSPGLNSGCSEVVVFFPELELLISAGGPFLVASMGRSSCTWEK